MANPYAVKGPAQFWRTAIADVAPVDVSPIPFKKFHIGIDNSIATAGSCFAQNVSKYIGAMSGVKFLQTETAPIDQPVFSARYGNIYTVAQLRQLLSEATGQLSVPALALRRPDGYWVDAFRPTAFKDGFASARDVAAERRRHLGAVQRLFSECSVFVFTLGLIEGWMTPDGQFALPIHPGIVTDEAEASAARFHRYSYGEIKADLETFLKDFHKINPQARVILTVSPVPLTATFTDEHILSATIYSKSILRSVCGDIENSIENAFYFPSYEIISSHYNNGSYYEANKRSVTDAGVNHVMRIFKETYFDSAAAQNADSPSNSQHKMLAEAYSSSIVCDEEKYGTNIGF